MLSSQALQVAHRLSLSGQQETAMPALSLSNGTPESSTLQERQLQAVS
jgi:hypothetical protein